VLISLTGEKIKGREPLVNLPFNWGDECPQAKLDGDRNELPLGGSCGQVSPKLKKHPTTSTLRSIETTNQIKKATTSQRTIKKTKSPTRATPNLSEQLVFVTTKNFLVPTSSQNPTTKTTRLTTRRRILQNQRNVNKRPSSNHGTDNLFSSAVLITSPSLISQPSTTTSTTIKKRLATTKLPKIKTQNVKKASTLRPQPQFKKREKDDAPDTEDRIW
jgi:hypothetical protein